MAIYWVVEKVFNGGTASYTGPAYSRDDAAAEAILDYVEANGQDLDNLDYASPSVPSVSESAVLAVKTGIRSAIGTAHKLSLCVDYDTYIDPDDGNDPVAINEAWIRYNPYDRDALYAFTTNFAINGVDKANLYQPEYMGQLEAAQGEALVNKFGDLSPGAGVESVAVMLALFTGRDNSDAFDSNYQIREVRYGDDSGGVLYVNPA